MCLASDAQFSDFLDGMGPAQFVGRQTLATTSMGEGWVGRDGGWRGAQTLRLFLCIYAGDVEIGLMERNGGLEVEVVQARGLTMKPGSKRPPGQSTTTRK